MESVGALVPGGYYVWIAKRDEGKWVRADCPHVDPKMYAEISHWMSFPEFPKAEAGLAHREAPEGLPGTKTCPTCGHSWITGTGDYSCAGCGMGMAEPCEHWKKMLATSEDEPIADREAPTELLDAAQSLLDWVPICSVGSSGYLRIERLKAALKKSDTGGKIAEVADREGEQDLERGISLDALEDLVKRFKDRESAWQKEREALREENKRLLKLFERGMANSAAQPIQDEGKKS